MNKRQFLNTAAASLLALGGVSAALPAQAAAMGECFGVATAGHNGCAGLSGLHSCKGTATMNYNPGDFAVVPQGTCAKMGGLTKTQAKAILADPAKTQAFEQKMAQMMMHKM